MCKLCERSWLVIVVGIVFIFSRVFVCDIVVL